MYLLAVVFFWHCILSSLCILNISIYCATTYRNDAIPYDTSIEYFCSRASQLTNKSMIGSPSKSLSSTPSFAHKKSMKLSKRRRSKTESLSSPSPSSGTQWYTVDDPFAVSNTSGGSTVNGSGTPPIELTQEVRNISLKNLVTNN